jgi:tight adherence protein B
MIIICLLCTIAAVTLALTRPVGPGLWDRLSNQPPRRPGPGRRRLALGLAVTGILALWAVAWVGAGGRGAVLAVAATMVAVAVGWLLQQRARASAALRAQVQVAHACEVLASHLRVGQVPTEALAVAAEDCPVLLEARQVNDVGGDITTVWRRQARRPGHGGLLEVARAWQVAVQTGAPLAATLGQVAAALSTEEALRAVVAGELASPRATSKVMAALPVCGLGLGYLLGGDPIRWLLAGPAGWACVLAGVLLACLGVLWIELLARQAAAQG